MPKLSIIIPIYNVEKYLPKCLESILGQSFKDFEIICVNDGSTDNSLQVLQTYKKQDDRIVIVDKKNEGSGIARNHGLSTARGNYVYFVDSDDWLENYALEKMIHKADECDTDILVFGGLSYYEDKGQNGAYSKNKLPKKYLNKIVSAKDIKKDVFKFPSTAWTKLYKRDFLIKNNIKFQNIRAGQDQLPFFHSMITAERIAILQENLYCYRKNRIGSVTAVKKKKNFSPIYVFYSIEELLNNTGKMEDYRNIFVNKYFSKATSWLGKFEEDLKPEYFKEYSKLLEHVKSTYPNGWWQHFNPKGNDSYWTLKFKQFFAKKV